MGHNITKAPPLLIMGLPTVPKVQLGAQQFCSFGDLNMMNNKPNNIPSLIQRLE
jgi:hypothetical protein